MIAERLNFRKYLGVTNKLKYQIIKGKYHIIDCNSVYKQKVIDKRRLDLITAAIKFRIIAEDLGDQSQLGITINEIIEQYEGVE